MQATILKIRCSGESNYSLTFPKISITCNQVISILLLKSTTGPSLPRPFSNFSAQLARLAHEDFGLEVNAGTMEVIRAFPKMRGALFLGSL